MMTGLDWWVMSGGVGKVSFLISARRKLILMHLNLRNIMAIRDLYPLPRLLPRDVSNPCEI
jgi:hypothetical protein